MNVQARIQAALEATGYPVTQKPVQGSGPVYLCYSLLLSRPEDHSSNGARTLMHMLQVDIFTRQTSGPELGDVLRALRAHGIRCGSWGPDDYEQDTGWHHMPITCYLKERIEEE